MLSFTRDIPEGNWVPKDLLALVSAKPLVTTQQCYPSIFVTEPHVHYTIMATHKDRAAKTIITPTLKEIGLIKRHPIDWGAANMSFRLTRASKMELDNPPDAVWLCGGGSLANR